MATLVTRANLDRPRGSAYIDELLREAYESSDTQPDKDAKAQARLDAALAEADGWIRRFIDAPLDWTNYQPSDLDNIRPLVRTFAELWLRINTRAGSNDTKLHDQMEVLAKDAAKLRERGMWSGSTVFQQPTKSEPVESASNFRRSRLTGLI